jgi:hypothetical protein
MHRELGLFSISDLEKGRVTEVHSDMKDLGRFGELESLIAGSIAPQAIREEPVRAKAPALRATRETLGSKGSFKDQSVMQKLLQYRDRIPLSSRIIRTGQS